MNVASALPAPLLCLSDLIGTAVHTDSGQKVGRVRDLVASERGRAAVVAAVLIRSGRSEQRLRWSAVASVDPNGLRLCDDGETTTGVVAASHLPVGPEGGPGPAEIHLGRDVLDAQIVDVTGRRLVRCSDVVLAPGDDGSLIVAGVEVGPGALVRRLGLTAVGRHLRQQVVPWADVHLVSRLGHRAQISPRHDHLERMSPDQLAHLLSALPTGHARDVVQRLPADRAARAIARFDDDVSGRILSALPEEHAGGVLDELPEDHAERLRHRLRRAGPRRRYRRTHGWRRHQSRRSDAASPGRA